MSKDTHSSKPDKSFKTMWPPSIGQQHKLRLLFIVIMVGFISLVAIHFSLHKLSTTRQQSVSQTRISISLIHNIAEEIQGVQTLYFLWPSVKTPLRQSEIYTELTSHIDQIFKSIRLLEHGGIIPPDLVPADLRTTQTTATLRHQKPGKQLDADAIQQLKTHLQTVFTDIEELNKLFQGEIDKANVQRIQQHDTTQFSAIYGLTQGLIKQTKERLAVQQIKIARKQVTYKIFEVIFILITLCLMFFLTWWSTRQIISTSHQIHNTNAYIKDETLRHKALNAILTISMQKSPLDRQLKKSLQIVLDIMAEEYGTSSGALFVMNPQKQDISLTIQIGLDDDLKCFKSFNDFSQCLCGTSFQSGETLQQNITAPSKCTTNQNRYCIPIGPTTKPIGLLMLAFPTPTPSHEKFTFLKFVTPILAGIILNSQYEQQLGKSELATLSIFQESDQAILLIRENEIIDWNGGASALFKAENLQDFPATHDLQKLLGHVSTAQNPFKSSIRTALAEGVSHAELRLCKQDGTFFLAALTFTTIPLHGEHIIYLVIQDISVREAEKQALIKAKDEAEKASIAKSTFLTTMSHEILTPLNAILGITALTMNLKLSSETRENLEIIHTSSQSLRALVSDILDISKIEADQFSPSTVPFSIRDILAKLQQSFAHEANRNDVLFTVTIDADTPDNLLGDSGRLSQVLSKLISNAFKYTLQGAVDISVKCKTKSTNACSILFTVQDTGIGISQESLQTIFNDFTQGHNSDSIRHRGAGLGLTISRKIVEKMNGTIWATSTANQGSCFYVEINFPLHHPLSPTPHSAELFATSLTGKKILVVEDSPINLKVTCQTLEGMGVQVFQAENGEECITSINTDLDAILMDVEMPIMDGIAATKIIRQNPHYNHIPIIAITAHGINEDRNRCFRAGMDDYMTKPLEPEVLLQVLNRNLSNTSRPSTTGPIDHEAGIAKVGGDADFFNEILQDFCSLHGNEGELLSTLLAEQEYKEIGERAHRLKGVAGTISAKEFAEQAKKLEELARQETLNPEDIANTITQVKGCIEEVLAAIHCSQNKNTDG